MNEPARIVTGRRAAGTAAVAVSPARFYRRPRRAVGVIRSSLGSLLALGFAAVIRAGAPASATPARGAATDSLTVARNELDALKSDAALSGLIGSPGTLPHLHIPAFDPSSPAPTAAVRLPQSPNHRTRNWLLDAMGAAPNAGGVDTTGIMGDEPGADQTDANGFERAAGRHSGGPEGARHRARRSSVSGANAAAGSAARRSDTAFNPLAQYMAQWMTPADYAVLRTSVAPRSDGPGSTGAAAAIPDGVAPESRATDATSAMLDALAQTPGPASWSAPRQNPYLQALAMVPHVPAPAAAIPPPAVAPAPGFSGNGAPDSRQPAAAPPTIPAFAKQWPDGKDFDPLKRF